MDVKLTAILSAKVDAFINGINQAQSKLQKFGDDADRHGKALSVAISLPLAVVGYKAVEAAVKMDSLTRGLTAVMGSAAAAAAEFAKLKEVAKLPGLGVQEAVKGSINLQAAGFSAELARKALMGFGNALATVGKGKSELEGVILALTQIASKGKISAEEINQIAERVPQIRKIMEGAFGTSNTEVLQKMGISSQAFVEKITSELEKLPKVTGGLGNSFENLGDTIDNSLARIGEMINNTVGISSSLSKVEGIIASLTDKFSTLSPAMQTVVVTATALTAILPILAAALGAFTTTVLPALSAGFKVLNTSMGLVSITIVGLVTAYAALKNSTDGVSAAASVKNKALSEAKSKLKDVKEGTERYAEALKYLQAQYLKTRMVELEADIANPSLFDKAKAYLLGFGNIAVGAGDVAAGKVQELKELAKAYSELYNPTKPTGGGGNKVHPTPEEVAAAKKALDDYVKAQSEASKSIIDSLQRTRDISISLITDETERKRAELKAQASDRRAQVESDVQSEAQRAREITAINEKLAQDLKALDPKISPLQGKGLKITPASFTIPTELPGAKEMLAKFDETGNELKERALALGDTIGGSLGSAFESFGQALATGKNPFAAFGVSILRSFGEMLSMIGKQMLKQAAALAALAIVSGGALSPVAGRTAIAGAALVAAGSAVSASMPKLARGGAVYGPTVALVGDNPGAFVDPEIIGPSSMMRRIVREETQGAKGGYSVGVLRGADIYLAGMEEVKVQNSFLR